jgi:hypothetical protein
MLSASCCSREPARTWTACVESPGRKAKPRTSPSARTLRAPGCVRSVSHLHNRAVAVHLQHLSSAKLAVAELQVHDLAVDCPLHFVNNHQRARDAGDRLVLCDRYTAVEESTAGESAAACGEQSNQKRTQSRLQHIGARQACLQLLHVVHGAPSVKRRALRRGLAHGNRRDTLAVQKFLSSLRRSHLFGVQHIRQLSWQTLLGMLRLRTSAVTIKSRTRSLMLDHRARPLRVWSMTKTTMTDLRRGHRCRRLRSAGRC